MLPLPPRPLLACMPLLLYAHSASTAELLVSATPTTPTGTEQMDEAGQLHIGDFVLGDGDCASLTGHPDIRY